MKEINGWSRRGKKWRTNNLKALKELYGPTPVMEEKEDAKEQKIDEQPSIRRSPYGTRRTGAHGRLSGKNK